MTVEKGRTFSKISGRTVLEFLGCLVVFLQLIGHSATFLRHQADDRLDHATACQLQRLSMGVQHYVQDHFHQLMDTLEDEFFLDLQKLQELKYWPREEEARNAYQQEYRIVIKKEQVGNVRGVLSLLITTRGGRQISDRSLLRISGSLGGASGCCLSVSAGHWEGLANGWRRAITPEASPGHLALLYYANGRDAISADTFLHRKEKRLSHMTCDLKISKENGLIFKSCLNIKKNEIVFKNGKTLNKEAVSIPKKAFFSPHEERVELELTPDHLKIGKKCTLTEKELRFGNAALGSTELRFGSDSDGACLKPAELSLCAGQISHRLFAGHLTLWDSENLFLSLEVNYGYLAQTYTWAASGYGCFTAIADQRQTQYPHVCLFNRKRSKRAKHPFLSVNHKKDHTEKIDHSFCRDPMFSTDTDVASWHHARDWKK